MRSCIEFCASEVTELVKCKQRVCRPLGGTSPLSDRASKDNGEERRPSEYIEAKATQVLSSKLLLLRSPRARHVNTENVGTWESQERVSQ